MQREKEARITDFSQDRIKSLDRRQKTLLRKKTKKETKKSGRKRSEKYGNNAMKTIFFDDDNITISIDGNEIKRNAGEYLTKEDFRYMDNEAYKFFTDFTKLNKRFRDYFDYNEINILDFVEEEFCFKSAFHYTIKDIVRAIGTAMKIIDVEQPYKVVVKDNVSLKNKIAILTAETMGLKTKVSSAGIKKRAIKLVKSNLLSLCYETFLILQKFKRGLSKKMKGSRNGILLLPYYANHADVMNPVIKLLDKKKENFDVVCVDNIFNVTKKRLDKYSIGYEIFEHYTNKRVRQRVRQHKKEFRKKWDKLDKDLDAQKAIAYRKIPLWDLLRPRLKFLFLKRFAQISEYIETTRHVLSVKKPSIVVMVNDASMYGRVALTVADIESRPSLLIQHGVIADEPNYNRVFADNMAVEGPEVKKFFVEKGLPQKKFIVTGQPRYDNLARREGIPEREEMCRILKINPKKKILVLATQFPECDEKVVRAVYNAVKEMDDTVLVVKLHPAERTDAIYQRLRKETGIKNIVIGKDIHLYGLLNASELMMTVFSTTALEAMMLDKPVITINLTGEPDLMPYASSGAAIGVYKAENLKRSIENILNNKKTKEMLKKNRERFVYGLVYKMDGKASERVFSLIKNAG